MTLKERLSNLMTSKIRITNLVRQYLRPQFEERFIAEEYIDLVQNSLSANNIIDTVNNANIIIDQERIDFIRAMETKRDIKFIKADLNEISIDKTLH